MAIFDPAIFDPAIFDTGGVSAGGSFPNPQPQKTPGRAYTRRDILRRKQPVLLLARELLEAELNE